MIEVVEQGVYVWVCGCPCCQSTHTAVSPVDVEEGEGEESLVALLWEELLFKLDKISLKVDHFWSSAICPVQKRKQFEI